jgi:hypothetical protein
MYYLQIGISIVFIISFFASQIYLLSLSVKVATRLVERKEAMRKSFVISFVTWMSMFFVYLVWMDVANWNLTKFIMVIVLITGLSIFISSLSALGLWYWKK